MKAKKKAKEIIKNHDINIEVYFIENSIPTFINAKKTLKSIKDSALKEIDAIIKVIDKKQLNYWNKVKIEIKKYEFKKRK